ncbi:hypothetical protein [Microbacterium sp. 18062]|uniref:hypothetical protein n=1 Tax=Microbacterium sp. 18062 TaxID=2681410 RepID=UPI0013599854|nr:hypothetical protein [Microbacterium sp. 18062]
MIRSPRGVVVVVVLSVAALLLAASVAFALHATVVDLRLARVALFASVTALAVTAIVGLARTLARGENRRRMRMH